LGPDVSPRQASVVLDERQRLFATLEDASRRRRRVESILLDAKHFRERVSGLVAKYAPELRALEAAEAARELVRKHREAQDKAAERARLRGAIAELGTDLAEAERGAAEAEQTLGELIRAAGVVDVGELAQAEARLARGVEIEHALKDVERKLLEQGDGLSLDELIAETAGADPDGLKATQNEVRAELQATTDQIEALAGQMQSLQGGLEHFETVSTAADAAQELASRAAAIQELTERWIRARVATAVLEREIQRYRETHQGPLLAQAAKLFPRLTLGAYKGLRVGREQPVLLCVRNDGTEVDVEGLSDGARRQLYLALRLASLEHWLERNEPLPLVLDDVLVHFDEARACAALEVLGELASRVQIVFFSHQARLVELARAAVPAPRLFVHELLGCESRFTPRVLPAISAAGER
jgi:uncharacterized protein YhaN